MQKFIYHDAITTILISYLHVLNNNVIDRHVHRSWRPDYLIKDFANVLACTVNSENTHKPWASGTFHVAPPFYSSPQTEQPACNFTQNYEILQSKLRLNWAYLCETQTWWLWLQTYQYLTLNWQLRHS